MSLQDAVVTAEQLPPLDREPWSAISPSYRAVLRWTVLLYCVIPLVGLGLVIAFDLEHLRTPAKMLAAAIVVLALFLLAVWVPRRVHHTQYLLRELDVHKRTGFWWHKTVSAGTNRVQHIEVTQGPIERLYGLSKLVLYTAGGYQSDIKIPGLPTDEAHRLKQYLTERIVSEELETEHAAH
ncbi:PH domain-containing protein [Gilvimarinus chinensis]|uniref:PH domain-containing protein n=1 Tax=Gilvimarinus chinensis TaxID=396005 RepID=UPI0003750516|nr:PH domain-containing protein [Gilvimarinus chinensis]